MPLKSLRQMDQKVRYIPKLHIKVSKSQKEIGILNSQFSILPKNEQNTRKNYPGSSYTPVRTHSIRSRVMKLSFLSLKMMVKRGLEFILKLTEPLQRYLLSCQANSVYLGRYFCTGQQQL